MSVLVVWKYRGTTSRALQSGILNRFGFSPYGLLRPLLCPERAHAFSRARQDTNTVEQACRVSTEIFRVALQKWKRLCDPLFEVSKRLETFVRSWQMRWNTARSWSQYWGASSFYAHSLPRTEDQTSERNVQPTINGRRTRNKANHEGALFTFRANESSALARFFWYL